MTDGGVELINAYIGPEGVLTGAARLTQEAREQAAGERRRQEIDQRRREGARRRAALERQIAELQASIEIERDEAKTLLFEDEAHEAVLGLDRVAIAARRKTAG
jgi:circadian clock protein KaiC